jgi:arginase
MMARRTNPFAGCFATDDAARVQARIVFAGLPDDSQSSYRRGTARAPERIRSAYNGDCYNSTTELGVELAGRVADLGDVAPGASWEETAQRFREFAEEIFRSGKAPFFAGGDHAVTVPVVAALAALGERVHVVQFDAHPDLYPEFEGSVTSHACVAARVLEMPHVATVTQYGIGASNAVHEQTAAQHRGRVFQFPARDLTGELPLPEHIARGDAVYITLDLDGFDPAFAPGVAHPVPGGLTPRQVINLLHRAVAPASGRPKSAGWRLAGMDAVEVNPELDVRDLTAILAGRILHEAMGGVVGGRW